jgi:thiamine pyrophosphate-dependent acetolactate synthase large subunit-like protein
MTGTSVVARVIDILIAEGVTSVCGYPTTPVLEAAADAVVASDVAGGWASASA